MRVIGRDCPLFGNLARCSAARAAWWITETRAVEGPDEDALDALDALGRRDETWTDKTVEPWTRYRPNKMGQRCWTAGKKAGG